MVMICSIAIAVIGLAMLAGRLEVRRGAKVILGCFIVLGASIVASGLVERLNPLATASEVTVAPPAQAALPPKKSRNSDDPYAGASLAQ